jgi:hypothetical protein
VVGFGGRLLRDEPTAKYINTPDTPLFKKKSLLFGLHRARAAIRENKVPTYRHFYIPTYLMWLHHKYMYHISM